MSRHISTFAIVWHSICLILTMSCRDICLGCWDIRFRHLPEIKSNLWLAQAVWGPRVYLVGNLGGSLGGSVGGRNDFTAVIQTPQTDRQTQRDATHTQHARHGEAEHARCFAGRSRRGVWRRRLPCWHHAGRHVLRRGPIVGRLRGFEHARRRPHSRPRERCSDPLAEKL